MQIVRIVVVGAVVAAVVLGVNVSCTKNNYRGDMIDWIKTRNDIPALVPKTVTELQDRIARAKANALDTIKQIVEIDDAQRTFENTASALDKLASLSDLAIMLNVTEMLTMVSTDDQLREAAQKESVLMKEFLVENIGNNVQLYQALKNYDERKNAEQLTPEQQYFLQQTLDDFKRAGLDLPHDAQVRVIALKKELAQLSQQFDDAIAQDNRTIQATKEQLAGLDEDFINARAHTDEGLYTVGIDYPTFFKVMENCTVADTRKRLYEAYNNRAYPQNEQVLKQVIAKRDELAQELGFASYAHLNLDDSMVGTPERAQVFLDELIKRSAQKEQQEFDLLVKDLPASVTLTPAGKINPWDTAFVKNQYKKKYLAVDEEEIAQYFPMDKTIEGLLDVYRQFLGIELVEAPISGLWHPDVRLIELYASKDKKELLGYLLLDLYPRDNKFSHACEMGLLPSILLETGANKPGLALLICNFTKATADKPSLIPRDFVKTFFHEFGHGIHQLLGRTKIASFSGTQVKRDFVEMPSQMLEEWLWDKEILQKVSGHYKTGEPLSDDLITKINTLKNFDSGYFILRQAFLSQLALDYYAAGADKDVKQILRDLYRSILKNAVFVESNNMYANFGHLMGYGAQYYGYMWSKVFALDMFDQIRKQGLLNPEIGKKYIDDILAPGGSKDPNELLKNFLGREPSQEAFFKDLGI